MGESESSGMIETPILILILTVLIGAFGWMMRTLYKHIYDTIEQKEKAITATVSDGLQQINVRLDKQDASRDVYAHRVETKLDNIQGEASRQSRRLVRVEERITNIEGRSAQRRREDDNGDDDDHHKY